MPAPEEGRFLTALLDDDPVELYEHAPCAYLSSTPEGVVVKVNTTFLTWTGLAAGDVVGRPLRDLLAPGDRIFYETHLAPALRMQGQVREIAADLECASGERLPVIVNAAVKADDEGAPAMVRTVMFDARERRTYERELVEARQRAEASEARARALAETLQTSFLPPDVVEVPGVELGVVYRPGGDGSEVGGDFYDVFATPHGTWAVVVGDVSGKGAPAAVLTALARHTVRSEALDVRDPCAVLSRVHDAFLRYHPDRFCTAVYMTVAPAAGGGVDVSMCVGGHPLPVHVPAGGGARTLGHSGPLLGLVETGTARRPHTAVLAPGDSLVVYTDGVSEARSGGGLFGDERVATTLEAAAGGSAQAIADTLVGTALSHHDGAPRDDIAVVVLKVREDGVS